MEVQKPIRALTAAAAGCCLSLAEEEAPDNKCPQFTAFTMTQAKSKRQITRADLLRPTRARSDPLITSAQPHPQCPAPGAAAPRPCWERGVQGRPPRLAAPCRLLGQPGGFGYGGAGGVWASPPQASSRVHQQPLGPGGRRPRLLPGRRSGGSALPPCCCKDSATQII